MKPLEAHGYLLSTILALVPCLAFGYDDQHPETLPVSQTGLTATLSTLYDDNVTRTDADILTDESVRLSVGDGLVVPLSPYLQSVFDAEASDEQFLHWRGLSHADLSASAQLQFRPSAAFYAPTLGVSERLTGSSYQTSVRSGFRSVTDLSLSEAITDRMTLFGAIEHEERRADNPTFNGHDDSARVHLDYQLSPVWTLYAGGEHRYGDAVSTSFPDPDDRSLSLARTPDPAFGSTGRITYRLKAVTIFSTLGINFALATHQSIDFSWRRATLSPARALTYFGATEAKYVDNQLNLSYLAQF